MKTNELPDDLQARIDILNAAALAEKAREKAAAAIAAEKAAKKQRRIGRKYHPYSALKYNLDIEKGERVLVKGQWFLVNKIGKRKLTLGLVGAGRPKAQGSSPQA